ncbi:hypothetical protein Syun_020840 [Stephania yunnanensis]|uniref:Protein kinase domain-containing protein n=1 Tax=Stephania yunnanensis TaxID=152371 RepID=A0AAP0IEN8_9MAGN
MLPPHWILSINTFSFAITSHRPNSTSILVTPLPTTTIHRKPPRSPCFSSPHLPSRPINLSHSPFRFPNSLCSRLSVVRPCSRSFAENCAVCRWDCQLVHNPVRLMRGCVDGRSREDSEEQGCKEDVFDYLESFLKAGFEIEWDEEGDSYFNNCRACERDNGVCGFNFSDPQKQFLCFQSISRRPLLQNHKQKSSNLVVLLSTLFVCACVLLVIASVTLIWRCRAMNSSNKSLDQEEDPTMMFLYRHRSANLLPPVFTFEELESSTNRFDPRRKIGDGGFGSVFLGQFRDGRVVAVKKLHARTTTTTTTKSFCNEILILSSIDHPNLVKLHGYCSDPRGLLLVYDYAPNGSLADHLHGSKGSPCLLQWRQRLEIALQTALAIDYLHFSVKPPVVHRDITSSNIFIDSEMRIKLGDFGLSRLLILSQSESKLSSESSSSCSSSSGFVWTGPQGTPGYLDPEYYRSFRLTEKSDVYSFGVVMFELITGLRAVDHVRREALGDLVVSRIQMGLLRQLVDPVLLVGDDGGKVSMAVDAVAELAFRCVATDKDDRPDAKEVVAELQRIKSRINNTV